MTGGYFNFDQRRAMDVARAIDDFLADEVSTDYPLEVLEKFRETSETLKRGAEMAEQVDQLLCFDVSVGEFLAIWDEEVRPYCRRHANDETLAR